MNRMDFTQAVARIRVLEKRLLNKNTFERMLEAPSKDEALKVLQDTEYGELLANISRSEDFDEVLKEELSRVYNNAYSISPDKRIVDIFAMKYIYHNIKVLLKAKYLKKDLGYMLVNISDVNFEKVELAINTRDFKAMPNYIKDAIIATEKVFEDNNDPQKIDIVLDKLMFEHMMNLAKDLKIDFITDYVKLNIDYANIKAMLRLKKQGKTSKALKDVYASGGAVDIKLLSRSIDEPMDSIISKFQTTNYKEVMKNGVEHYVTTGRFSEFEKLFEDYIMAKTKKAKYVTFGPEPIATYINAKETEIKIIRIIMVGKINGISEEVIRERLRDSYV